MTRRSILFVVLLLMVSMAAQGQRVISRIEVRGNVPSSIVLPQTALIEGRGYTDADLDVAVARIRRLPFVYDARYSIEGDALVIEVTGVTPLFYDIEATGARSRFDDFSTARVGGGGRLFTGSGGVAQLRLTKLIAEGDDAHLGALEYAHYGIGGTRFFASASVETALSSDSSFDPDPTWQLTVGYPLTLRQTLTASAMKSGFRAQHFLTGLPRPLEAHQELETFNIRWAYDTTEDPLFARRGTLFSVSPSITRDNSLFESGTIILPAPVITSFRRDGAGLALDVSASKLWPVFRRGSLFTGVEATTENSDVDAQTNDDFVFPQETNAHAARLSIGYGHNFFDLAAAPNGIRQRLELGVTLSRSEASRNGISSTLDEQSASLAYVFRHRAGSVRASFAYAFD